VSAERVRLPLFPLNTVLYPGGLLPLKVFEQRYVEMTKACLRDGTVFGVCAIREGAEVGEPAVPVAIGCTARIEHWDLPHPNIFHIRARGERRFRVLTTEIAALGLLTCEAELLPADPPAVPDARCRRLLETLIERLGESLFSLPHALDDAAWVGYRLAEILPLDVGTRQALLEIDDPGKRLETVRALLARAGAE